MSNIAQAFLFMLLRRLFEPSTWAGVAALVAEVGLNPAPLSSVGSVVLAIGGALAIVLPEGLAKRIGVPERARWPAPPGPGV